MNKSHKAMTQYFRGAVASALHLGIDFKRGTFHILDPSILIDGQIPTGASARIFAEASKKISTNDGQKIKDKINVVISAKTVKTNFKD